MHSYRTLQHFDHWLSQHFLGNQLINAEISVFKNLLNRHFGKHVLLLGVPHQRLLLQAVKIPCHTLISPFYQKDGQVSYIEADFNELPLLTGSIDLVLLPHTLEFVDNPRQVLSEACRVIKPEGLIVIAGFNPYSTWGLRKWFSKKQIPPWSASFIPASHIKRWLQLAEFALEEEKMFLYAPPLSKPAFYQKLQFLEKLGNKIFPAAGGVYTVVARAKIIPLTPIKLKWKQPLNPIRITPTIPGPLIQ